MEHKRKAQVFYACQFENTDAELIYHHVVLPFCNNYGYEPYRSDKHATCGKLSDQIFDKITESNFFAADISSINSNVLIELGHALSKLGPNNIILFQHHRLSLPFNIYDLNTIKYSIQPDAIDKSLSPISDKLDVFMLTSPARYLLHSSEGEGEIFHYPLSHHINTIPWDTGEGGQGRTEYDSICIKHSRSINGNWPRGSEDGKGKNASIMRLMEIEETKKVFGKGGQYSLQIRAKADSHRYADGHGYADLVVAIDGTNGELNKKYGVYFGIPWEPDAGGQAVRSEKLYSKGVTIVEIDFEVQMQYKKDGEWYVDHEKWYDIEKNGLAVYLGCKTSNCDVYIYEMRLVRRH